MALAVNSFGSAVCLCRLLRSSLKLGEELAWGLVLFCFDEEFGLHPSPSSQAGWSSGEQSPSTLQEFLIAPGPTVGSCRVFQEEKPEDVALLPADSCTQILQLPALLGES